MKSQSKFKESSFDFARNIKKDKFNDFFNYFAWKMAYET